MKVSVSEISSTRMSVNPPQEVVNSGYLVIHNEQIKHWVGIGWVIERSATPEDYNNIPEVID